LGNAKAASKQPPKLEVNEIPKNVSESVRKRNPHLYPPLGGVETHQPKPAAAKALAARQPTFKRRKGRLAVVVTFIAYVHRELDTDNLAAACKPLRDAVSATLGIDDGDKRIRYQYGQVETRGRKGVVVKIESL